MGEGTVVGGRYRVLRPVGRGGFAETYEAERVSDGARVLLKRLSLAGVEGWKDLERFEREARTLAQLEHPGIPRYVDHFESEGDLYLAQALFEGRSLADRAAAGWRPTEAEARSIARQVLEVLVYLHGFRPPVVHRDVTPANILLADSGQVALVDFGAVLANALGPRSTGSTTIGTFGYMAPEQVRGAAEPRSDLYSLGVCLLSLLAGREPEALPARKLRFDVPSLISGSGAFADFLVLLLEPAPEDRHASAQAALDFLARGRPRASARPLVFGLSAAALVLAVGYIVRLGSALPALSGFEAQASEAISHLQTIRTAQESFRAEMDLYVATGPVGPGGALGVWEDEPCNPACSARSAADCRRFSCIGFAPGRRVRYRYACSTTGPSRAQPAEVTCAAYADLDGDGRGKMFVIGTGNGPGAQGRIVAPIPAIGAPGQCAVGETYAGEVVDCDPGVW